MAVDTFFADRLKCVGKVHIPTVLFGSPATTSVARLCTSKIPVTARTIAQILSDNGPRVLGRNDDHPNELFLQLEEIEPHRLGGAPPRSNGFDGVDAPCRRRQHAPTNAPRLRDGGQDALRGPSRPGSPPSDRSRKKPAREEVNPAA